MAKVTSGRYIDGVLWLLQRLWGRKSDAQEQAKNLRDKGFRVRIIKMESGYGVYKRTRA